MNPIEERVSLHYDPRVGLALLVLQLASGRSLALTGDTLLDAAEAVLIEALAPEPKEEVAADPVAPPSVSPLGYTCTFCYTWVPLYGFHSCPKTTAPTGYQCSYCGQWVANNSVHSCGAFRPIQITYGTSSNPSTVQNTPGACINGSDDLGSIRVTSCFGFQ